MNTNIKRRIWEIDFLRGMALLLMIYFHVLYDLNELFGVPVTYLSGINYYTGKVSGTLFILISGISCSLSRSNTKRGLKVLGLALIITLATTLFNPDFAINFGILHFLGVSMLLYVVIEKINPVILFLLSILVFSLDRHISAISVSNNWFFVFGVKSNTFISSDYYPLIPWFGVFLLGVLVGKTLYSKKVSLIPFDINKNPINFIGRHTLLIYLLHQPAILLTLNLLGL